MTSTEQAPEATTSEHAPDAKPKRALPLRAIVIAVGALAVAALLIAVIVLGNDYRIDRQTEAARTDSVDAAGRQAVSMFAYDFKNVDTELPKAVDGLTGDLEDQYKGLIASTIAPGAKEKQLTVKVSVQGGSVVSASPQDAVVLLFLNQVTTSKDTPQAVTSGSRLRMTLHKDDGRWLVSNVKPI